MRLPMPRATCSRQSQAADLQPTGAHRQALIDGAPVTTMGGHLLPRAVMAVVFIPLGVFVFGRAERYAKRTGKLKRVG